MMAQRREFFDTDITQAYGEHVAEQRAAAGAVWLEDKRFIDDFLARLPEGGLILDVGAGTGNQLQYFYNNGFTVHFTEGTEAMVVAAKQTAPVEGKVAVLPNIPYDAAQFDGIFSRHVLHHLTLAHVKASLENTVRVLKDDGYLALIMPVSNNGQTQENWYHIGSDDYIRRYFHPIEDIQAIFRRLGLHVEFEQLVETATMPIYKVAIKKNL